MWRLVAGVSLLAGCSTVPSPAAPAPTATPPAASAAGPQSPTLFPVAHPSAKVDGFTKLLDRRLLTRDAAGVEAIDAEIRAKFERTLGVMITDMSGMTELTKSRGILGILALIREMQHVTVPVLRARGATWVKMEADDLFVTHTSAKELLAASREMLAAVKAHNAEAGNDAMKVAVGLGWGKVIDLDDDLWGDAVNTASKLGEDTAEPWEILVTEDFHAALLAEGETDTGCTLVAPAARKAKFPYYSCR